MPRAQELFIATCWAFVLLALMWALAKTLDGCDTQGYESWLGW